MNNVFFKPWVGKDFQTVGYMGKKLLFLGESHYCEIKQVCAECGTTGFQPECKTFTNDTVEEFLQFKRTGEGHKHWMNTYTKFGNVLMNRQLTGDETIDLWQSIAFYNHVQIAVANKRMPPSTDDFRFSEAAFSEVLKALQPDLVIAWGKRLWNNLPATGQSIKIDDSPYFKYTVDNGKPVPVFSVYHPSTSYFNYSCHEPLTKAIERCEQAVIQECGPQ